MEGRTRLPAEQGAGENRPGVCEMDGGQVRNSKPQRSSEKNKVPPKFRKYERTTKKIPGGHKKKATCQIRFQARVAVGWVGGPVIKEADGQRRGNASLVRAIFR